MPFPLLFEAAVWPSVWPCLLVRAWSGMRLLFDRWSHDNQPLGITWQAHPLSSHYMRSFSYQSFFLSKTYYSELMLSQEFQLMAAQLSMKAAVPLAKTLATASRHSRKTGPWVLYENLASCGGSWTLPQPTHQGSLHHRSNPGFMKNMDHHVVCLLVQWFTTCITLYWRLNQQVEGLIHTHRRSM